MTLTLDYSPGIFERLCRLMARIVGADTGRRALEERFNEMVRVHDAMILRICFGYARTTDELDDLHQDALVNIWQGLPGFRSDSSEKTWIYRVTLNTCVATIRSRSKRPAPASLSEVCELIDESAEERMQIAELHERINRLSPLDKAIVLLRLEDFSYEEIAAETGLPRNTVATRLRRAKEKIKNVR